MTLKIRDYQSRENIDVLFLGSSHTYMGIDTRVFDNYNISSFNLGTNSQTPIQTYYLLKKYLDTSKVKIVAIETNISNFTVDGIESSLDLLFNEGLNYETSKIIFKTKNIKAYNSYLYLLLSRKFNNDNIDQVAIKNYITGGYAKQYSDKINTSKISKKPVSVKIVKNQIEALEKTIDLLEKKNIPFFFFQTPVTTYRYKRQFNDGKFDEIMQKYNVKYIDFNGKVSLDDIQHFRDDHHLNQSGVNKFNPVLVDYINSIFFDELNSKN